MTAKATAAPPTRAKKMSPSRPLTAAQKQQATADLDEELRRMEPEEVVARKLLPYRSARALREKCYRREVIHHNDAGRITFTADDIRRENERTTVSTVAA